MTHLIIGGGEVGRALLEVLSSRYDTKIRDKGDAREEHVDVLHIAYPHAENFIEATKKYIDEYAPGLVVIHSTVPVGTAQAIGSIVVSSPIRGTHPNLAEGIKTFVKYFGGPKAKEAADIFTNTGIPTRTFEKAETTELAKLLDTTYYAWNIIFAKEVKRVCDETGLDFREVYTIPNKDYNEGYAKLGKPDVIRPVLKPKEGPIGGHCVIPNAKLLNDWLTETIKKRNKKYK
ncbi:MAG: hypothetical protein Q7J22_01095 [Candidatus Wolfebacteria bacterium]|nr:hypothetical protein [Candidatus Wolfebacteria bacterium]